MNNNETLTFTDLEWIGDKSLDKSMGQVVQPKRSESQLEAHILATAKLSRITRSILERRLKEKAKKIRSLRERKKYTRQRGHVHPKKKQATEKRRLDRKWADKPFSCFIHGWGAHQVDKALWDKYIAPLWDYYLPADLTIKRYKKPWGSKEKPYTIYGFDVVHSTLGVVYSGSSQELYDLSTPKEPDCNA